MGTFTRSSHKSIETKAENKINSKRQKNGYKSLWIGVANATKSAYYIETHTELFVPEYDTGVQIQIGGNKVKGIGTLPAFKYKEEPRKLKVHDSTQGQIKDRIEQLMYKRFLVNTGKHNSSNLIELTITKVENPEMTWKGRFKSKQGVIIAEKEDGLEVIQAAGQFLSSSRWKPSKSCRNPDNPKTFDPTKTKSYHKKKKKKISPKKKKKKKKKK